MLGKFKIIVGIAFLCLITFSLTYYICFYDRNESLHANSVLRTSYGYFQNRAILVFGYSTKFLTKEETLKISNYVDSGVAIPEMHAGLASLIVVMKRNGKWIEIHSIDGGGLADIHIDDKFYSIKVDNGLQVLLKELAKKYGLISDIDLIS